MRLALAMVATLLLSSPAFGQEERPPINTNRPTQGTNTAVVGPGTVQLETGVNTLSFKGGAPSLTQLTGQLRVGTGETTEISVFNPFYNNTVGPSGVGDTTLQMKWQFARTDTAVFAVVPNVTFQTGTSGFRGAGTSGQLLLTTDITVGGSGQTLTLNLAGITTVDATTGDRFGQVFTAAYYTFPTSPTSSMFLEISGIGPDASSGGVFIPAVDGGMSFLLDNDTAFDFDVLKGLGSRGVDWAATVGLSRRF